MMYYGREHMGGSLSWTGVMTAISEGPEIATEPPSTVPRVPVWSVVCIASGLALIGLGLVMNEPVSKLIFAWMR